MPVIRSIARPVRIGTYSVNITEATAKTIERMNTAIYAFM